MNNEINQIVNGVVDFANNMGKYFDSSDFSLKKEILQILIPNSLLYSKKLVLSITKPFDTMLKSKNYKVWCTILRDFRANNWQELLSLYNKIKHFQQEYEKEQKLKV